MIILPFQTNFSRFFRRKGPLPIPNNISLIVDKVVIECNGPILAQHSQVLFDKLTKNNEVYLDEFSGMVEGVLDCVEMLYGADVVVTLDNLQALMKFSILFKVEGMYEVCVKWVQENASLDKFSEFFKIGHFVFTLEQGHGETLEACRDLILRDVSKKSVEILRNDLGSKDNDQTNLMLFFLEDGLMDFTLPIVTDWINTNEKVVKILGRIDDRHLLESLFEQTVKRAGLNFITKLCEISDTVETSSRAYALQSKLMKSLHKMYESKELELYLLKKQWTRLSGKELIEHLSEISTNHALYIEVCIASPSQVNVDALWPTIDPSLVGKHFCNNIQKKVNQSGFPNLVMQYPEGEDMLDGYYKMITKEQCKALIDNMTITILFDCQINGCTHTTEHAVTVKLAEEENPCYDLSVGQTKDPAVQCHVHPRSVIHWYIYYDLSMYGGRPEFVSLATKSYQEVISIMRQCNHSSYSQSIVSIGCIIGNQKKF